MHRHQPIIPAQTSHCLRLAFKSVDVRLGRILMRLNMGASSFLRRFAPASLLATCVATLFAQTPGTENRAETPVDDPILDLERVTVTAATRTEKLASALPVSTTVLTAAALERQLAISTDLGNALAQAIPSYAPSRQKLTSSGESFRGRDPLYLVDGIPQSNPLRAGQRESSSIDPFFLERVEVVHGSSAAQGLGATGGIINFVTRRAPETDGVIQRFEIAGASGDGFNDAGFGGKAGYLLAARSGAGFAVVGAALEHVPMAYDGDGRTIGVDNVQGDTLDSDTTTLFAKLGYDFTTRHSLELMVNHFDLVQNLRWVAVAGDRATGRPTTSTRGQPNGEPAENDVVSAALTFTDRELWGGELTVDLFLQDFKATYGASDTPATRNNFRVNGVPTLDQSQIEARKHGLRTTFARTFDEWRGLGLVTGFDYLADETAQVLILTGRTWVPFTTYEGWSPYAQLEFPFGPMTVHGGVRAEFATLDVPDFSTIESAGSTFVRGGSPSFEELLFNLGGTWRATSSLTWFGGYTQGFGMPDVGRVLRAINRPGQSVTDFIDLQPVVTDNWETGVRWHGDGWKLGWSVYYSKSDLGSRLAANAAGIYSVERERTEITGTELTGDFRLPHGWGTLGGYLAVLEGKSDRDGDGEVDLRLPAANITAPKVALYWDRSWTRRVSTRLQSLTLLDRDDPADDVAADFDGYTLLDLLTTVRLARGDLTLGVENLLDEQAITYHSQTRSGAEANAFNHFATRGRTITLGYRLQF